MDFKTATDRVAGCISHAEIAEAAGVSVQTIRQARLDPSAPGHRPPPADWKDVLVRLARARADELNSFANGLAATGLSGRSGSAPSKEKMGHFSE